MANEDNLSDGEYNEICRHSPRIGYWLGLLLTHLDIEALRMDPHFAPQDAPAGPPVAHPPPYPVDNVPQNAIPPYAYGNHAPIAPPHAALPNCYANWAPAVPQNARSAQRAVARTIDVTHIMLSIPLNTGVVGGFVTQTPLHLPVNLTFQDFYSRVCTHMDLEPLEAHLGYKLPGDRKSDVPFRLLKEEELRAAMEKSINLIKRARTREVVMEIFNMEPAQKAAKAAGGGKKHGAVATPGTEAPETTVSFIAELRQLKQHLQDVYKLTSWAKSILFGEAMYGKPPSAKDFDHVAKRCHRSGEPHAITMPAIHVHFPGYDTNSKPAMPLTNQAGQRLVNTSTTAATNVTATASVIDLTNLASSDDDDAPLILYPSISTVLRELHAVMPLLDYPQYKPSLLAKGIFYVNNAIHLNHDYFVDIVGMPEGVVGEFLNYCRTLVRRAMRGKGKAVDAQSGFVVKKEEEN